MSDEKKNPLKEIAQPFVDLIRAPRALWGVNLGYFIEGIAYWGFLAYLAMHFSDFVFQGVANADTHSHRNVAVLTAGITIAMFFLGFVADKFGIRRTLIAAFAFLFAGRAIMAGAPTIGLEPQGVWSSLHWVTLCGIMLVVIGYGMYQPAAYAAVKKFTTPKTAAMGFAMLYALMNLGGWIPTFFGPIRERIGIVGAFWVYTALTFVGLIVTALILSPKTERDAVAIADEERKRAAAEKKGEAGEAPEEKPAEKASEEKVHRSWTGHVWYWMSHHPLTDLKFTFFIFALIPVQTLFTYNWFILPQYVNRAFEGWLGRYFEVASNLNPLLIFIFVPIVTALTQKKKVYNMMILGTFVMAAPAFLLVLGPNPWTLFSYIIIMTIGEAMWQPRFLQYAAEIAPEGRTGEYMGVAQLPWFLTKILVPLIYSGQMLAKYCPADGPKNTEMMWLIFGCIAITSTVLLVAAKGWIGKDFKTKADD